MSREVLVSKWEDSLLEEGGSFGQMGGRKWDSSLAEDQEPRGSVTVTQHGVGQGNFLGTVGLFPGGGTRQKVRLGLPCLA